MPKTIDPYTFLEWTANNTSARQAVKLEWWKAGGGVGYGCLFLSQCIILSSFVIEAAAILKPGIIN